jgi:hypothetical protein
MRQGRLACRNVAASLGFGHLGRHLGFVVDLACAQALTDAFRLPVAGPCIHRGASGEVGTSARFCLPVSTCRDDRSRIDQSRRADQPGRPGWQRRERQAPSSGKWRWIDVINAHVVSRAAGFDVRLAHRSTVPRATLVSSFPVEDLAVIRLEDTSGLLGVIAAHQPGDVVRLTFTRSPNAEPQTVTVIGHELPAEWSGP